MALTDALIRDLPDDVLAAVDAKAGRLGLSRSEYVGRRLAQDAELPEPEVTAADLARLGTSPEAPEWASRIGRGLVRITTVTRFQVGYSARSGRDLRAGLRQPPLSAMPAEYPTPAIEDRAVQVQAALADRGQHRAPSVPDLIIAATAELAGLTVLHLHKDFELVAEVTGQPWQRLRVAADASAHAGPGRWRQTRGYVGGVW